nr:hypothetical protein [Shewanella sp. SG44-6]
MPSVIVLGFIILLRVYSMLRQLIKLPQKEAVKAAIPYANIGLAMLVSLETALANKALILNEISSLSFTGY